MEILEPIMFVNICAQSIEREKLGNLLPVLNVIALQWGLNLSRGRDIQTAVRIIKHSINNN